MTQTPQSAETRRRASREVLDRLRRTPTSRIGDSLRRAGVVNCEIKGLESIRAHLDGEQRLAGNAFTVRYAPVQYLEPPVDAGPRVDQLFVTRMHDLTERGELVEGDVIVIDAGGAHYGFWGETTSAQGVATGIAGAIVDGCVRDIASSRAMGFEVYARGNSFNRHDDRYEIVDIGGAVVCGGATVHPGDVIIADEDGVVVVPEGVLDALMSHGIASVEETESGFKDLLETFRPPAA